MTMPESVLAALKERAERMTTYQSMLPAATVLQLMKRSADDV